MDLGEHRHLGDGLAETFHGFANEQRRPALLTEAAACAGLRALHFVAGRAEADCIGAMRDHAERAVPSVSVRELRPEASPHHDGMARRSGIQGGRRLPLLWLLEKVSHRDAAVVVVRGTRHREHLAASGLPRVTVIRDGCADQISATLGSVMNLRHRLGLDGRFGGGVMGSLVFSAGVFIPLLERGHAGRGLGDLVAQSSQDHADEVAQRTLVFDDEDTRVDGLEGLEGFVRAATRGGGSGSAAGGTDAAGLRRGGGRELPGPSRKTGPLALIAARTPRSTPDDAAARLPAVQLRPAQPEACGP